MNRKDASNEAVVELECEVCGETTGADMVTVLGGTDRQSIKLLRISLLVCRARAKPDLCEADVALRALFHEVLGFLDQYFYGCERLLACRPARLLPFDQERCRCFWV